MHFHAGAPRNGDFIFRYQNNSPGADSATFLARHGTHRSIELEELKSRLLHRSCVDSSLLEAVWMLDSAGAKSTPMAIVTRSFDAARSYLGSFTWSPLVRLSRAAVLGLLGRVEIGHIAIIDHDGSETICGERWSKEGVPATELTVLKEAFWVRLLLFADMVRAVEH